VKVCVCVCVFTGFKCSFLSGVWLGETLEKKKAEKSRTRTYGPPPVTEEGEIQEPLEKNGSKRKRAREFKNNINTAE